MKNQWLTAVFSNLASKSSYGCYTMGVPVTREIRENASEVKFSLDPVTAERVREFVRALLAPDPHAGGPNSDEYSTTTLYFDTADYAVYSRRGSYRRAKYRVRRYGQGDMVFLERKLRTTELLSKRRSMVRVDDLPLISATKPDASWAGAWFQERLIARKLAVVAQVTYQRTARVGMTDYGPIRLTIDEQLRGLATTVPEFVSNDGAVSLTPRTILEMKFRGAMPSVFKTVVEEFALKPAPISKYRLGIEAVRPDVAAAVAERLAAAKAAQAPTNA